MLHTPTTIQTKCEKPNFSPNPVEGRLFDSGVYNSPPKKYLGDLALFDCSLCVPVTHWACAVNQAGVGGELEMEISKTLAYCNKKSFAVTGVTWWKKSRVIFG